MKEVSKLVLDYDTETIMEKLTNNSIKLYYDGRYLPVVCVCFLPLHSGHQVRWTYQPGSHRRKFTQDFSSTFLLQCVP